MKLEVGKVYLMNNGERVAIEQAVTVSGQTWFYRGVTQRGKSISYDANGVGQFILGERPLFNIKELAGMEKDEFKAFHKGSLWVTHGGRVWEVLTVYTTVPDDFPVIANEVLPDGTLHANIKRFNWDGKPHDGSSTVLVRNCT
jgi:hypothetical protein